MDFPGYFLIVSDFINSAREKGILVGPGRGSAAGSLVCYCLGITNVNPLDYNLLFERFLNPERISMPDIDIDFQDDRRDEVIQYAKNKYGENAVAQIITFNKLAPRGVLKDVGRVLNFPFQEINDLTKLIPIIFGKVKPLSDCYKEVPDFKKYFEAGTEEQKILKKNLFDYSSVLENLNKNSSIHASGVVVAPSDVIDYVPLSKVTGVDNVFCTQYDMNQLEEAGLIKIDFLGLKELKVISKTLELVNKKHNLNLTPESIPLDDEKTYELFSSGSTIGIFQFSKSKMREYLSKLKPKNINDLAAMNALYRPGPMKLIPDFIEKRMGKKPVTYLHPKMENALKETYGIIVYQEQVMQIGREVAGFTMAQADNMRKAMGKKIKEKMKQVRKDFISGAVKNGVPQNTATEIFELMYSFADYGFNKSHGVAYSILAFYTAYLKTHYPLEFFAISMESRKDDETELQLLAEECNKMNIVLRQPDINLSYLDFKIDYQIEGKEKGSIIYGLSAIKNVGEKAAENIVNERNENGSYKNFIDFLTRVDLRIVNKKAVESLVYAGAFDELETNRRKLFCNLERATLYAQRYKDTPEAKGQEILFTSDTNAPKRHDLMIQDFDEFPEIEKFNLEKSVLGFYLTGHPLEKYRNILTHFVNLNFGEDITEIDFTKLGKVKMCGVISGLEIKLSKRGSKFAVFSLIDFYGTGECIAFSKLYEQKQALFENDKLVFVEGRADENGDKIKLILENICSIESFQIQYAKNIVLKIEESRIGNEFIDKLKMIFEKFPGSCNVYINLLSNGSSKVYRSKEYKIEPKNELISYLKKLIGENNLSIN
jgi:DNA polymerase-3 subunit alpha